MKVLLALRYGIRAMALHTLAVVVLRYGVGLDPGIHSQHNIALPPWICSIQLAAINGTPYSLPSQPWYAANVLCGVPAAPWRGQNVLSLAAATLLPPPALHFDDWSSTPGTGADRPPVISHLHFSAVAQMGR